MREYNTALSQLNLTSVDWDQSTISPAAASAEHASRYFFHLQEKSEAPYLLWNCNDVRWIFSCDGACLEIYYRLVKKCQADVNRLVHSMNTLLGEDHEREKLGHAVERAFKFLGPRFKIEALIRRCSFTVTDRLNKTCGSWQTRVLVGGTERVVSVDGLPEFPSANDSEKEFFFTAPAKNPLFDFAHVCGSTVDLFQVTVEGRHNMAMKGLDNVPEGFTTVNFFMIRVAMCPEDLKTFQKGNGVSYNFTCGVTTSFVVWHTDERSFIFEHCCGQSAKFFE
jgi:hypothetical protein